MAVLTSNYPASLDTTSTLGEVSNRAKSTLAVALSNTGETQISLSDASGFPNSGAVTIDNEIFYYSSKAGNVLTIEVRAQQGTAAATHLSSALVYLRLTKGHWEVLRTSIINLETKLGTTTTSGVSGGVLFANVSGNLSTSSKFTYNGSNLNITTAIGNGALTLDVSSVNPILIIAGDSTNGYYPSIDIRPLGVTSFGGIIQSNSTSGGFILTGRNGSIHIFSTVNSTQLQVYRETGQTSSIASFNNEGATPLALIDSNGKLFANAVGVGMLSGNSAKLHVISVTEQLRLGYDVNNYFSTTVGSNGVVTFDAIGSGASFTFNDTVNGITKAMVGLSAVEDTALSTWGGSTNITTIGTLSTKIKTALSGAEVLIHDTSVTETNRVALLIKATVGSPSAYEIVTSDSSGTFGTSTKYLRFESGVVKAGSAYIQLTDTTGKIVSTALNTVAIAQGGTGQTTQQAAIDALVPTQTGQSGKTLGTNGTTVSWVITSSGVAWGGITGTLSSQTDLQNALNLKANLTGASFTGNITATLITEQIRASYDVSNYFSIVVNSIGLTTLTSVGTAASITIPTKTKFGGASNYLEIDAGGNFRSYGASSYLIGSSSGGGNPYAFQYFADPTAGVDFSEANGAINVRGLGGTAIATFAATGSFNVGIGISSGMGARLHVIQTSEQLRVGYDGANYFSSTVGATGIVTLNQVGAGDEINFQMDGVTIARIDNSVTAGNTRFLIYDVDNATLERVTVGVADSGGVGFKLLRIAN